MEALQVASPSEYRTSRLELLAEEKALTKALDKLAAKCRTLPVVEVTKAYEFASMDEEGNVKQISLIDLFNGRRQLIVYHHMFDPDWDKGCAHCSIVGDSIPQRLQHLHARSTSLVCVSRAPIEKIRAYKKHMGWQFPWVSSYGSDFNYDFQATQDETMHPIEYNYKPKEELLARGLPFFARGEQPGYSCFIRGGEGKTSIGEEGKIYHTYSTYARGGELVMNTYCLLDMTKLDRLDSLLHDKRADDYTEEELKYLA